MHDIRLNRSKPSPKPELSECPLLAKLEALSADVVDLKRDADALRCRAITETQMDSYGFVRYCGAMLKRMLKRYVEVGSGGRPILACLDNLNSI